MNKNIITPEVQDFIGKNWQMDGVSLLLKKPLFPEVSQRELVEQLQAKKKCKDKLPTWYGTPNIYFPNKINIEQTSSEVTARYKAGLVKGQSLLDMSGGLGVDSFYFSKTVASVTHCEIDPELSKIAAYNFGILDVKNCNFHMGDGLDFLATKNVKFDWIYADPSRRNQNRDKVFRLTDCTPNIPKHLDRIFSFTDNILLKASPLIDLTMAIQELQTVSEIHVVAVQNEVKEVLFVVCKTQDPILVKTININTAGTHVFDFSMDEESRTEAVYGSPLSYLYEPNAAILKAGAFKRIGAAHGLVKLGQHSHLYTSDRFMDFPGRVFSIESSELYNKKTMRDWTGRKANVATRNFPENVAAIRKRFKIRDGGDSYLFFTRDHEQNLRVLHCRKIRPEEQKTVKTMR